VAQPDLVALIEMSPSNHRLRREFGDRWEERVPLDLNVTLSFSVTLLGRQGPERKPGSSGTKGTRVAQ
jgi:hypothetical protein